MIRKNTKISTTCLTIVLLLTIGTTLITTATTKENTPIPTLWNPSHPLQLQSYHTRAIQTTEQKKPTNIPYVTIDLSEATDPLGVNNSEAVGINNHGEIVGYEALDDFKYRTIYWNHQGTATFLDTLPGRNSSRPYMIDDNGLILGWAALVWYEWIGEFKKLHMNQTAVTWKNQEISDLNDDASGGDTLDLYHARDNNNAGTIVGSGAPPGNIPPPWWPNGFILDNGNIIDLGTGTYPYAINNQGHIAGYIDAAFNHAYEWDDGTLIDLNNDPLIKANYSQAYDINDNEVIVGIAQFDYSLLWEPVVWRNHSAIRLLPTDSQYAGSAFAVNEHDEVVGYYDDLINGGTYAFLWKDNQLIILNDYLPSDQHWEVIIPEDINDQGQIVGLGYRTDLGFRAFLMTPAVPEFNITIEGGKGIAALINNTGYAPATNITWDIKVDGGLIFVGKETTGSINTLDIGETTTITAAPKGIGLGLFLPLPSITIDVFCTEGISLTKTIQAKIIFSKVTIQ